MKAALLPCLTLVLLMADARAGEFINLGFDDPDLSNVRRWKPDTWGLGTHLGLWAPVDEVFRGWTVDSGTMLDGYPYYGLVAVDFPTQPFSISAGFGGYELSADRHSYYDKYRYPLTLSQVATIPADAALLHLNIYPYDVSVGVLINGQGLPLIPGWFRSSRYVDVSRFAGSEVELTFRIPGGTSLAFNVIGFEPIPEPSSWGLMLLGGLLTLGWLRRRQPG